MATREVCDVFDTHKEVERFTIVIERVGDDAPPVQHHESHASLCPRAFDRLVKFIDKGIHPPGWKAE